MKEILISLSLDGDKWCARVGEDLMTGIACFGPDPFTAIGRLNMELRETYEFKSYLRVFGTPINQLATLRQQVNGAADEAEDLYSILCSGLEVKYDGKRYRQNKEKLQKIIDALRKAVE